MKGIVFHAILGYIKHRFGDQGYARLCDAFGHDRIQAMLNALPTEWLDMAELRDLHETINTLFDDGSLGVMRDLGRHFAEQSLTTAHRAFLSPGRPEIFHRRTQLMFSTLSSAGETQVKPVGQDAWCLSLQGSPLLDEAYVATMAGYIQCYLEMAGATGISTRWNYTRPEGQPLGEVYFSYHTDP
jgi:uncharacterized protein (TIGR02265 family)